MKDFFSKIILLSILLCVFLSTTSRSEVVKEIKVNGNERISDETIKMFSTITLNQDINDDDLNKITKNLYQTNFFENIFVSINDGVLIIEVKESPVIGKLEIEGIKSKTLKENLYKKIKIKSRNSYNEFLLKEDSTTILNELKNLGYYSAKVEIFSTNQSKNIIDITYEINLGEKARIKKLLLLGAKFLKIVN